MEHTFYFDNYSPAGDIVTVAICMVITVLVATSFVKKTRSFTLFLNMIICLVVAAFADMVYHYWYVHVTDGNYMWVYISRIIYHTALFAILFSFYKTD